MTQIKILTDDTTNKELLKLAGNSKSIEFPCKKVPKAIKSLFQAEPYSGHDLSSGLIPVLINTELSKASRCVLLFHYGKYLNISSSSLMHKPELAGVPLEDTPYSFKYGISFVTNVRLLKRIVYDLTGSDAYAHFQDLADFVSDVDFFLDNVMEISVQAQPKKSPINIFDDREVALPECEVKDLGSVYEVSLNNISLSLLEQVLRYSSSIIFTEMDLVKRNIMDKKQFVRFVATREQLETIISQRKTHKLEQWHSICEVLERV